MEKISVDKNQEHNPTLKLIRNVPWEYADTDAPVDYRLGKTTGVLFLSVRYHRLHPNYIYERLRAVPKDKFRLSIILLLLDDHHNWSRSDRTVREITRASILLNWTVALAWSNEEAARWLESLHSSQHRTAAIIRERPANLAESVLTEVGLNKTDVARLMAVGSMRDAAQLSVEELQGLWGFGKKKAESFRMALNAPFNQ